MTSLIQYIVVIHEFSLTRNTRICHWLPYKRSSLWAVGCGCKHFGSASGQRGVNIQMSYVPIYLLPNILCQSLMGIKDKDNTALYIQSVVKEV